MRLILLLIIFQLFSLCNAGKTHALNHTGVISDDIHYSDLEILYYCKKKRFPRNTFEKKKPQYIKGLLRNRTDKALYLNATLRFRNNFNTQTAEARIRQRIPAYGQANFKSKIKLGEEKFSGYRLEWDIIGPNTWRPKAKKKKEEEEKIFDSSIRELINGVQITGRNSVTTETFQLKKGDCVFTVEVIGKNFLAYLKNKETRKNIRILSQNDQYKRSEKIVIEKDGPFSLRITTNGSWRIRIDYPPPGKEASEELYSIKNDRYLIHLKNGKALIGEQLTFEDKKISFICEGTQLSINRNKVLKTEPYEKPE